MNRCRCSLKRVCRLEIVGCVSGNVLDDLLNILRFMTSDLFEDCVISIALKAFSASMRACGGFAQQAASAQ